jgi:hypothetical protein
MKMAATAIEIKLWPKPSVAGSGIVGTGGAILVLVIVLTWVAAVRPPFYF